MSEYNISGGQIGAVGDNAKSFNNKFNMTKGYSTEVRVHEIIDEITKLQQKISQCNQVGAEEKRLIEELENMKKVDDVDKLINEIQGKATKKLYEIATGVGSGIIANIIFKSLNL